MIDIPQTLFLGMLVMHLLLAGIARRYDSRK